MDERRLRMAAFYTLVSIVDKNDGCIKVRSEKIKRVFNNEFNIVIVEYSNGKEDLAYNLDFKTLDFIVKQHLGIGR